MKYYYYFWLFIIVSLIAVCLFNYYDNPSTHYIGEKIVTPEEYTEVMSSEIMLSSKYNILTSNEDGSLKFTYDFFSLGDYNYLNKRPHYLGDIPLFYNIKRAFTRESTWVLVPVVSIFLVVYYYVIYKRGKIYRMATTVTHYFEHQRDRKIPLVVKAVVVTKPSDIKLNGNNGIIVVRSWKVDNKGTLTSIVQNTKWKNNELVADKHPDRDGVKGIYGYRLGANIKQSSTVMGVVELNGKYEYHAEGIVRAEHCKMIGFFMSKGLERTARFISNKYNVPVYLDESSEVAYLGWLYSEEGQKSLQHNFELLKVRNERD